MTSTLYMGLFYKLVIKKLLCSDWIQDFIATKKFEILKKFSVLQNSWIKWILLVFLVLAITIFVAVDSKGKLDILNHISFHNVSLLEVW